MFFNQDSTCVLKAKLTAAVAASQLKISVTYRDNTDEYQPDAIVSTNGTTEVTLLAAPTGSVVNIVELIKIYNPDTQANTVQILANDEVIASYVVGAGKTVSISAESINVDGSNLGADTNLSNLTATGKAVAANMAMPSNSYTNLTLGSSGSTYTAPANGRLMLRGTATGNDSNVNLRNTVTEEWALSCFPSHYPLDICAAMDVKKGAVIQYYYNQVNITYFRFIYAQGEV